MKTVVMIDGGYLRAEAKKAGKTYDNTLIERFARSACIAEEYLFRILYYDSPQFEGEVTLPVSRGKTTFTSNDHWLTELSKKERFAVRRGTIGFRGWQPKANQSIEGKQLTDADFSPLFEQKGVDMRVGLDIAVFSDRRTVDRIILVSGDTDMIPAMKHARKAGLEIGMVQIKTSKKMNAQLVEHSDFVRVLNWPE